jgi:hypothetical protein
MILVLFNANPEEVIYELPEQLAGANLSLHPVMANADGETAQIQNAEDIVSLPARSTIVLVVAEDMLKTDVETGDITPITREAEITEPTPGKTEEIATKTNPFNENGSNLVWLMLIVPLLLIAYLFFIIRNRNNEN